MQTPAATGDGINMESSFTGGSSVEFTEEPYAKNETVPVGEDGEKYPEYVKEPDLRDLSLTLVNIPRFLVLGLVRLYQATFSRTLPQDTCRFYPSCSHYGYQAIYKYGVIKGGFMAAWRVLRCNPFNKGGFDPVP